MTGEDADEDRLFEEALDLVIRLQADPANPVAQELVQRWRARGAAHEAVWAELAEIHGMAGKVLTERERAARRARAGVSRRTVIVGAAALAAAGAGALYGPDLLLRLRADYATATAELRRVTLADGTRVTLGPDSALRIAMGERARRAEILSGMAFFEVAPDPARRFEAIAGGVRASALDTAFEMSSDAGCVTVCVDHGLVEVAAPGGAGADRVGVDARRLSAGDLVTLEDGERRFEDGRREPGQVAAWRDGLLIAERETIAAVIARIGRWYPGRILVAAPSLGARRISGVFDLANPMAALAAVVQPYNGRIIKLSTWVAPQFAVVTTL